MLLQCNPAGILIGRVGCFFFIWVGSCLLAGADGAGIERLADAILHGIKPDQLLDLHERQTTG